MTTEKSKNNTQIIVAIIGLFGVLLTAVFSNWDKFFPNDTVTPTTIEITKPTNRNDNQTTINYTTDKNSEDKEKPEAIDTSTKTTNSECRVRVEFPMLALKEKPDPFSQDIAKVPVGWYDVLESKKVTFVSKKQRWFKIMVNNRKGWIRDNIINIEEKTSGCP